jgi:hypothetical protein
MNTDRELLELAAKAAGIRHIEYANDYDGSRGLVLCDEHGRHTRDWAPLTDEGDALRLAIRLGLDIELHGCMRPLPFACAVFDCEKGLAVEQEAVDGNRYTAACRAIVRAASEIGRAMP